MQKKHSGPGLRQAVSQFTRPAKLLLYTLHGGVVSRLKQPVPLQGRGSFEPLRDIGLLHRLGVQIMRTQRNEYQHDNGAERRVLHIIVFGAIPHLQSNRLGSILFNVIRVYLIVKRSGISWPRWPWVSCYSTETR